MSSTVELDRGAKPASFHGVPDPNITFPEDRLVERVERFQRPRGTQLAAQGPEFPDRVLTGRGWLWVCPRCEKHVLHLYFVDEGPICRTCGKLDYSTRHGAGRAMPEAVKLTKLRAKLGADPALIAPLPPRKGRRMYRRSYLRTLRAIEAAETKLAARLSGMSDRLLRASASRHCV